MSTNISFTSTRATRQRAMGWQIQRLERRTAALQVVSNRVSWLRVGIFVVGIASGSIVGIRVNELAGWALIALTLIVFTLVVLYHRHLERWIQIFTLWRAMRSDQLARMALDWDRISASASRRERTSQPLALDLDLTGPRSLHQLLDTTVSRPGSELLAEWLTISHPILEEIHKRQSIVRELRARTRFRERFWLTFRLVLQEQLEGRDLLYWLNAEFPSRRLPWLLAVGAALVVLNFVLFGLWLGAGIPPLWILSVLAYAAFYLFNVESLNLVLTALVRLDTEVARFSAILKYIETQSYANSPNLAQLCAPLCDASRSPSAQIQRIKWVTAGVGLRSNPYLGLLFNLVLHWDFVFAFLADHYRGTLAQSFPVWAQVCYQLDALIALANFSCVNPDYVFPEITPNAQPIFRAEHLGHPLIPYAQCVHNDLTLEAPGEIAIITGSNMAGKSTFIKTVGINLCLAYAGAPVNASQFRSVPFRLHTCIRISDSVVDGFSYFYAEVKCLKRLLDELQTDSRLPLLYLIDEIFRGTNQRERLLGSRAFLRALVGRNGVGLIATHDLELARLADTSPLVHNYHFEDQVADGRLIFDYKIRPGPSTTTNALKIMQMEGLPVETG